jgi:hypothetical protein
MNPIKASPSLTGSTTTIVLPALPVLVAAGIPADKTQYVETAGRKKGPGKRKNKKQGNSLKKWNREQRGRSIKLIQTKNMGEGVAARKDLTKDDILSVYGLLEHACFGEGQPVANPTYLIRTRQGSRAPVFEGGFNQAVIRGRLGCKINAAPKGQKPNVKAVTRLGVPCIIALRNIRKGEQLFLAYNWSAAAWKAALKAAAENTTPLL